MKKIGSKLSMVLLLILSFVVMLGATASMLVRADAQTNDEPAAIEVYSNDWYEITITDNSLTILLSAEIGSYRSLSRDDLTDIKNAAVKAIRTLVINKLLEQGNVAPLSAVESMAINEVMPLDISDLDDMSKRYRDYLYNRLIMTENIDGQKQATELAKFLAGHYDILIEYAATSYIADYPDVDLDALTEKVHTQVAEIIKNVLAELSDMGDVYVGSERITEELEDDIYDATMEKLTELTYQVYENKGEMSSVDIARMLEIIYGVKIGDYKIYNGQKFVLSEIKGLIASLPKPAEIASWADDEMNLSYDISVETALGDVEFNLTVGFMGDSSYIREAAQFIADHFTAYDNNGVYTVEVTATEELSALLLKLSNSSRIPDDVKLAVFKLFNKTGDEIFDKASGYSYQQILDYLKGKDFQSLFAGMLDAQKIKDYFGGFGIDLSKLTDEKLDEVINTILQYAEKIANKKDVEGIEDFLKSLGVPVGIPSQFDGAVQKFLNLLNKIDYKYWNATTIREFLNDNGRFNAKVDALLTKLANSASAEKLYNQLVELAESVFNSLPEGIHNNTILNYYRGNGEIAWAGNVNYDLKELITKVIEKLVPYAEEAGYGSVEEYLEYIDDFINSYFEGELVIDVDLSFNLSMTDIYKVEYVVNDETIGAGLLPVGADVVFYANKTEVDGLKIIAWVDEDGNEYTEMPAKDVTLYAVTEFEAYIAFEGEEVNEKEPIEKVYDGEPIVLTVEFIGAAGANPKFTWYKDGEVYAEIIGMEGATLELVNVADSGVYYCVVTNGDYEFLTATTQEVTVIINKADLTVEVESTNVYNGEEQKPEITVTGVNGEILEEGIDYEVTYNGSTELPENVGEYIVKITLIATAKSNNYNPVEDEFTYEITPAKLTVKVDPASNKYNGKEQKPEITVTNENGETLTLTEGTDYIVTYNGGAALPKNVGVYTVEIELINENYELGETTYTYEITPADLTVRVSSTTKTYNGNEQKPTITITGVNSERLGTADYTVKYLIDGKEVKAQNVGVYTVVITLNDTEKANNYNPIKNTYTFKITEAALTVVVDPEENVYNGEVQLPGITVTGVNKEVLEEGVDYIVRYLIGGEEAEEVKNVGVYTVEITLLDTTKANNYKAPAACSYTITLAERKLEVSVTDWTYGEYDSAINAPKITGDLGDGEITYIYEGINGTEYGPTSDVPTNAGEYKLTVKVAATGNYKEQTADCTFTVYKADIKLTVKVEDWTYGEYDEAVNAPQITGNLGNGEVTYLYEGNGYSDSERPENAGEYTLTIEVAATENYNGGTASCTFTIAKKELDFSGATWVKSDEFNYYVYNGEEKSVEFRHSVQIPDDVELEVLNATGVDAGTYRAYIVIEYNPDNYTVILPVEGYDEDNVFEWVIEKATLDFNDVEIIAPDETVEFDGENHFATYSITGTYPDGTEFEFVVTDANGNVVEEAVNVGEYTATLTISTTNPNYKVDEDDYQITRTWEIIPATIDLNDYDVVWDYKSPFEFDGEVHTVKLIDEAVFGLFELVDGYYFGYVDNSKSEVGKYTAQIVIFDSNGEITDNYDVIGYTTCAWLIYGEMELDFSGYKWTVDGFSYDGKEHSVKLVNTDGEDVLDGGWELIDGFELTYFNASATNAGTYYAYIAVVKDGEISTSYIITGLTDGTVDNAHEWSIAKQVLEIEEPVFSVSHNGTVLANDAELAYDGTEYEFSVSYYFDEEVFNVEEIHVGSNINVGTYTITVTISLKDTDNYSYTGNTVFTHSWTIVKATIEDVTVAIVVMQYGEIVEEEDRIYNGDPYYVKVIYPEELFNITVTGTTEATDARSYYITIVISLKYPDSYTYEGSIAFTELWTIMPDVVEVVNPFLEINGNKVNKVVYDKDTLYTASVNYNYDAEKFDKYFDISEVSGDLSAQNVGIYTVTVKLAPKFDLASGNYRYYGQTEFTLTWEITAAVVGLITEPHLTNSEGLIYSGETYTVGVEYSFIPADAVKVDVSGTLSAEDAGTYTVYVVITLNDPDNYSYSGQTEFSLTWEIARKVVTLVTEPQLKEDEFIYNGSRYTVEVDEYESDPADMFNVSMLGNTSAINAGTYSVTIVISLKDSKNYVYNGATEFTRSWEIKPDSSVEIEGGAWKVVDGSWEDEKNHTVTFNGEPFEVIFEFTDISIEDYSVYYEGVNKAVNAGVYEVKVTIVSVDGNHGTVNSDIFTLTWEIKPAVIDLAGYTWTDSSNFEYNEGAQSVVLTKDGIDAKDIILAKGYSLKYYGNTATNAGTYYAYIAVVAPDGGLVENYVIKNLAVGDADNTYEWAIATKVITITESWIGESAYEFDGNSHTVTFNAGEYASYVDIEYVNNQATDAGDYVAVAKLTSNNSNYTLSKDVFEYKWSITAKTFKLDGYTWSATELEYSGSTQTITLVDADGKTLALDLAAGYSLQYVGNAAENVGVYEAFVIIVDENGETGNYILSGNTSTAWSITKKVITVETSWSATTEFEYDGEAHGVNITVSGEYADYVTVTESNNSATAAGNYVAVAELALKAEYSANYELSQSVYTLSWKIVSTGTDVPQPPVQGNTTLVAEGGDLPEGVKVTVTASEPLPDNCSLVVSATPNNYSDDQFQPFVADGTIPKIVRVYGIEIANLPESYGGNFTVTISNSEFEGKDLIVVHVPLNADGTPVDREEWEKLDDAALAGKNITFSTPGFSDFAVVEQVRVSDAGSILWLMWLMLIIILILLIVIILLLIKLLRDNGEPAGDEEETLKHPVVIIKTVEEAVEEEQPEEAPAVEEESEDEDLDEQAAALLIEDASEEAAQPVEGDEDVLVAADGSRVIYDRSFTARLIQSDSLLKDFYTELKNYILSYKGVKSRISWHFDSFNLGREKCVKIQFRGKSMYMYIPLAASEVPEKYNVKDVSEMSRYEGVPTMFKVRKPRSLKYAKELIDMVMEKLRVEQGEIPDVKYRPRYRSTTSLIDMGLIKVKTTNSTFFAAKINNNNNNK